MRFLNSLFYSILKVAQPRLKVERLHPKVAHESEISSHPQLRIAQVKSGRTRNSKSQTLKRINSFFTIDTLCHLSYLWSNNIIRCLVSVVLLCKDKRPRHRCMGWDIKR